MLEMCIFLKMYHAFSFLKNLYLFIFGCAGSSLLHGLFSSCGEQELVSICSVWVFYCGDFSCCRALALGTCAPLVVARSCGSQALEHRLSSRGTQT